MSHGKFILSVRVVGNVAFGILSAGDAQKYDEASRTRNNRREAVLEAVKGRRDAWQSNYPRYAAATFRIEEVDADGVVTVAAGQPYETSFDVINNARKEAVLVAADVSKIYQGKKKSIQTAAQMSDYLINTVVWDGHPKLTLDDKIRICREVAADIFTPVAVD